MHTHVAIPIRADVYVIPGSVKVKINLGCPLVLIRVIGYITQKNCPLSPAASVHKQGMPTDTFRTTALLLLFLHGVDGLLILTPVGGG